MVQTILAAARGETVICEELRVSLLAQAGYEAIAAMRLTVREREILLLLAHDHTATEAAEVLHVSRSTVKAALTTTYGKLGVKTQAAAVAKAIRTGLLD